MSLETKLKTQIFFNYWPGFVVGMYPSVFAYENSQKKLDLNRIWSGVDEINLYFHVPFCKWKCAFCTFPAIKNVDDNIHKQYKDKIIEDIREYSKVFNRKVKVKSICFGGGTPNTLKPEYYQEIFDALKESNFILDNNICPSMEMSPEILTLEYLEKITKVGIKRVSIGVQSLQEDIRKYLNREELLDVFDIVRAIRRNGLAYNIDLINGLYNQTAEDFISTLSEVIKLKPESISIYPLSGTANSMFKKNENIMSTADKYKSFDKFYDFLMENGYECESHVKFLHKENPITHEQKIYEYEGVPTLGIGYASRSYAPNTHYIMENSSHINRVAVKGIDTYLESSIYDLKYKSFNMSDEENQRRFIIYSFFTGGFNIDDFQSKFNVDPLEKYNEEFTSLENLKLITINKDTGTISSTKDGIKYTDIIGTAFWSENISNIFNSKKGGKYDK
tara:strand:- start:3242 stop:4585 length:1344 start_codon:yes stop_codon:yes gene_type:complete